VDMQFGEQLLDGLASQMIAVLQQPVHRLQ
jgi:hypothetical protein